MISLTMKACPRDDVQVAQVHGEAILLDTRRGMYYGLDDVGARIWALLGECDTVGDVLAAMLREYDVEEAVCRADLIELLEVLAELRLVRVTKAVAA